MVYPLFLSAEKRIGRIVPTMLALAIVVMGCSKDSERDRVGREFRSIPECVDFIRDDLDERLKIMTDEPSSVSGMSAENGLFFVCDSKETGTRGRVISGRWDRVAVKTFTPQEVAKKLEAAKTLTRNQFNEPASAEFRGLYVSTQGTVCGQVKAKDQFGAYTGFDDFIALSDRLVSFRASEPAEDFGRLERTYCKRPLDDTAK